MLGISIGLNILEMLERSLGPLTPLENTELVFFWFSSLMVALCEM